MAVSYEVIDNCEPAVRLDVTSSEADNGLGDGNTTSDWEILDVQHVRLRAERAGGGSGRVYSIAITVTDSIAQEAGETVQILVPHHRRPR